MQGEREPARPGAFEMPEVVLDDCCMRQLQWVRCQQVCRNLPATPEGHEDHLCGKPCPACHRSLLDAQEAMRAEHEAMLEERRGE